ncbi:MAG: hypothetical protein WDN49_09500 [Acetobacteraceae bacterium]
MRAAAEVGTPVLIVRAGDFFGPKAANNWFSQGLVKPGKPVTTVRYPGKPGVGHQWAYLPDVAETMAQLWNAPMRWRPSRSFTWKGIGIPTGPG